MSNSDDEARIAEEHALLEWARQAPTPPDYDSNPSEEAKNAYEEELKRFFGKKPATRNPYDTEKR